MKLNYFEFKLRGWNELAMILMIFDPWLFKVAGNAKPAKGKKGDMQFPDDPIVILGLVDLDLEDIEVFLPPPVWDQIKDSIRQIESSGHPGSLGGAR